MGDGFFASMVTSWSFRSQMLCKCNGPEKPTQWKFDQWTYGRFKIKSSGDVTCISSKVGISIFIPYWYRWFFGSFSKKNNPTDVRSPFYESNMCYSAEILFKTAIKGQKNISIPHQYRYGFCKN